VFTAVVTEVESGQLVSNLTALSSPSFALTGLRAEQEFLLSLYASNSKGRSKEVVLHGTTPKLEVAERPTDQGRYSRRQTCDVKFLFCFSSLFKLSFLVKIFLIRLDSRVPLAFVGSNTFLLLNFR
jgi:hypothetical protein